MSKLSYAAPNDGASPLKFNSKAALRFCELIDPKAEAFDFRDIGPEWLSRKDPEHTVVNRRGSLSWSTLPVWLKAANRDGRGIYMTINETDGRGVRGENVVRVRAVFADLDDGLPKSWPLDPSFIVSSSPGKYQAYWLVKDKMKREAFASVMRGIAERWSSAGEAKDIARVLRVPGFWHRKKRDAPYRVRFHSVPDGEPVRYEAARLVEVFGVAEPKSKPSLKQRRRNGLGFGFGDGEWSQDDVESMLAAITDWDSRDRWLKIGMALHNWTGGNGYGLWCKYASQSEKFDERDSAHTWAGFKRGRITLGTLVHLAKEDGWQPERREYKDERDKAHASVRAMYANAKPLSKTRRAKRHPISEDEEDEPAELIVRRLSEYQSEHIEWLWKYRVPKGMISLLAGFGDVGKSTLLYDIAAKITRGASWPNNEGRAPKGSVIFFNREDTPQHIIRPRILAAGGDPDKVYIVNGVHGEEGKRTFNISTDLDYLDRLIAQIGDVQLVVFDPLSSYFDSQTNTWRESQVRHVLEPMAERVNEWDVALIGNTHLGKTNHEGNANLRILNSVGIVNLARIINVVEKDPEDPELRVFGQTKRNIAKAKSSLRFSFETKRVDRDRVEAARLVWQGESDVDVESLMSKKGRKLTQRGAAEKWLKGYLNDGPQTWEEIVKAGHTEGHTERTLRRARDDLNLIKVKERGVMCGRWQWALPDGANSAK